MKVYKILHVSSGLYYKPSTFGSRWNLTEKGKVYSKKPSVKSIINRCYPTMRIRVKDRAKFRKSIESSDGYITIEVNENEFKVEEFVCL